MLLPCTAATAIKLVNRQTRALAPVAYRNLDESVLKADEWDGRSLDQLVLRGRTPLIISNVQTNPAVRNAEFFRRQGLVSYLGIPLVVKGEPIGIIVFYTQKEIHFSKEEIEFLSTFAGQAAVVINNSQLYEQTKKQAVELEKASRARTEFFSVVSHELRTPVAAVIGYAEMIRNEALGKINHQQDTTLMKILRNSNELLSMISSILEASRIEAGIVRKDTQEVDLRHFLGELRASYDVPWNKEISLIWDYPPALPTIQTDAWKLRHILQNLINNAVKFTDKGRVTVWAKYFPQTKVVQFRVTDTGVGIPQESLPVIFEMFRQADSST